MTATDPAGIETERANRERARETAHEFSARKAKEIAGDRGTMFEDLESDEQIERLRQVVRHLDQQLAVLTNLVHELLKHQHGADGRLVVPMTVTDGRTNRPGPEPAKRWL